MLKSKQPNNENNETRNRPMTDKAEAARNVLDHKKTLETLIALDTAFGCLLDNIKTTQPELAASLAIDLQQAQQQMQLHLPEEVRGACELVGDWSARLQSQPSGQGSH